MGCFFETARRPAKPAINTFGIADIKRKFSVGFGNREYHSGRFNQ
jgi:hypothetical protein